MFAFPKVVTLPYLPRDIYIIIFCFICACVKQETDKQD